MKEKIEGLEVIYCDKSVLPRRASLHSRKNAIGIMGLGMVPAFAFEAGTEVVQAYAENNLDPQGLSPLEYGALYHSGDFGNGFYNAVTVAFLVGGFFPRMSYRVKTGIAAGLSALAIVNAEVDSPIQFYGAPEPADIPSGLLGIGLFVGVSLLARRAIKRGSRVSH